MVTTSSTTSDDFGGRDVVFSDAKDRTGDNLNDFNSSGVDDKEQHL